MDVVTRSRVDVALVVEVGGVHLDGPRRLLVVAVAGWVDAAARRRRSRNGVVGRVVDVQVTVGVTVRENV